MRLGENLSEMDVLALILQLHHVFKNWMYCMISSHQLALFLFQQVI